MYIKHSDDKETKKPQTHMNRDVLETTNTVIFSCRHFEVTFEFGYKKSLSYNDTL